MYNSDQIICQIFCFSLLLAQLIYPDNAYKITHMHIHTSSPTFSLSSQNISLKSPRCFALFNQSSVNDAACAPTICIVSNITQNPHFTDDMRSFQINCHSSNICGVETKRLGPVMVDWPLEWIIYTIIQQYWQWRKMTYITDFFFFFLNDDRNIKTK